jgi:hypothetical protein
VYTLVAFKSLNTRKTKRLNMTEACEPCSSPSCCKSKLVMIVVGLFSIVSLVGVTLGIKSFISSQQEPTPNCCSKETPPPPPHPLDKTVDEQLNVFVKSYLTQALSASEFKDMPAPSNLGPGPKSFDYKVTLDHVYNVSAAVQSRDSAEIKQARNYDNEKSFVLDGGRVVAGATPRDRQMVLVESGDPQLSLFMAKLLVAIFEWNPTLTLQQHSQVIVKYVSDYLRSHLGDMHDFSMVLASREGEHVHVLQVGEAGCLVFNSSSPPSEFRQTPPGKFVRRCEKCFKLWKCPFSPRKQNLILYTRGLAKRSWPKLMAKIANADAVVLGASLQGARTDDLGAIAFWHGYNAVL